MLLRIRQLPQPQQSTFGSHTPTRTLTCKTPSPKPQPGAPTTTTTSAFNCLPISHTHVRTHAVHMRRRAWQKLRTKKRSGAHRTDESEINVFIFVCIYTAGYRSTDTHKLREPTHPSISTLDIFIRCHHNKFWGRKNKTHIPNFPSGHLFSASRLFSIFCSDGVFLQNLCPLFSLLFLNPTLVYKYRSVAFQPVIIKHSSYKTWAGCTRPPGSAELHTNMATNAKQTRRC